MDVLIILNNLKLGVIKISTKLNRYYYLNDLTWQEGFFFDFIQKKFLDNLVRKFFIFTVYLLNERTVFDRIVKILSDVIIFLTITKSIYSYNNIASLLATILINIILLVLTVVLLHNTLINSITTV